MMGLLRTKGTSYVHTKIRGVAQRKERKGYGEIDREEEALDEVYCNRGRKKKRKGHEMGHVRGTRSCLDLLGKIINLEKQWERCY